VAIITTGRKMFDPIDDIMLRIMVWNRDGIALSRERGEAKCLGVARARKEEVRLDTSAR
jgi:hypothetical protein